MDKITEALMKILPAEHVNEVRKELKTLDQAVDKKIQRALDNPLAK